MKTLDSKFLRKTLSKYSTGVTVVTSIDNNEILKKDLKINKLDILFKKIEK